MEKTLLAPTSIQKIINLCRKTIYEYIEATQPVLGGERAVEIGETLIARRKYNRGRLVEQQWLFGAIERGGGNIFFSKL